jgi:hypothetical protein
LPGQLVPLLKRLEIEQDAALKAIWPSLRTEIKATGETNFPKKSAAAMQIRNYILEEEAIHRIEKLSLNALQLKALPIEIYQLKNLSHLELKQNAFREVPHFHRPAPFYSLFSVEARSISVHPLLLQWIDLSENQISQLTVVSSFLHQKGTLVIGHNPLSFLGDHLNINDLASLRFSRDSQFGALPSLTQLSKKTLYHIQDLNDNHVECKQLLAIHSFQVHFCCTFPLSLCCQGFLELNAKKIKCIQKIELKEALFLNKKINLEKISLSKAVTQLIFDRFDAIKKQTEIEHYIYKLTFTIHERKCEKNEEGRLYKKLIASKFTTLLAEAVSMPAAYQFYPGKTPLGRLCQVLERRHKIDPSALIKKLYNQLPLNHKAFILQGGEWSDRQQLTEDPLFYANIKKALIKRLTALEDLQREVIFAKIYSSSGYHIQEDNLAKAIAWGEKRAQKCFAQLADELEKVCS